MELFINTGDREQRGAERTGTRSDDDHRREKSNGESDD